MKKTLLFLASISSMASIEVVKDSIQFPNYGSIKSNKVCFDQDSETFKAKIKGKTVYKCLKEYIDRSDSTRPQKKCLKYKKIKTKSKVLTAPLYIETEKCVSWNRNDSTNPKCVEKVKELTAQNLSYAVEIFLSDDYRKERGSTEIRTVKNCQ